jgi:hypothetical protein
MTEQNLQTLKDTLIGEKYSLDIRIEKLKAYIDSKHFSTNLNWTQREIMQSQYNAMLIYSSCLHFRIDELGTRLETAEKQ